MVLLEGVCNQLVERFIEIVGLFQNVGEFSQLFGHDGVERNVGTGDGLGRTQHTEFKFVTGESQRRGSVSVSGILGNGGQNVNTDTHVALFRIFVVSTFHQGFDNAVQLVAQENGDDGGRCFVGTQAVVIAGIGNSAAQQILIFIHTLNEGCQEQQELCVLVGSLAGPE